MEKLFRPRLDQSHQTSTLTNDSSLPSTSGTSTFISLDTISPAHKRSKSSQRKTPNRRAQQADIVTGSPYKRQLIEKQHSKKKKEAALEQKRNRTGKKSENGKRKQAMSVETNRAREKKKAAGVHNTDSHADVPSDCECPYCEELFSNSNKEDWIQCNQCKQWSHETCTDYIGLSGYTCDFCR
jgi:hypothetical protein